MAKNSTKKKCIHCFKVPEQITNDHVIPKSWYSSVYSRDIFKPTAPSCYECNNKLGAEEKSISHLMWACMPESNPLKSELNARLYEACGLLPDGQLLPGLKHKERVIRRKYLQKLVSMTRPSGEVKNENIFPGFGFHDGYAKEIQRVVSLDVKILEGIAKKVVAGLEYIQGGRNRYIEHPYRLEVYFPKEKDNILKTIENVCKIFSDGTNTIQRGSSLERPLEPIYIIKLWNQWEIWGAITADN